MQCDTCRGRGGVSFLVKLRMVPNSFFVGYNAYGGAEGSGRVLKAEQVEHIVSVASAAYHKNTVENDGRDYASFRASNGIEYLVYRVADYG